MVRLQRVVHCPRQQQIHHGEYICLCVHMCMSEHQCIIESKVVTMSLVIVMSLPYHIPYMEAYHCVYAYYLKFNGSRFHFT